MAIGRGIRCGLALLALGLLLGGCATSRGRELDQSLVQRLQPGQTTEQEVRAWLGPPQETGREGNRSVLRYWYGWEKLVPLGHPWMDRDQRLDVVINEQGRLEQYSFVDARERGFLRPRD